MAWSCLEVLSCIALVSSTLTLAFARSVFLVLRRAPPVTQTFPGISVLKPLKGAEDGLLENLRSLAAQDYPHFEVIFGCQDPHDPARAVVEQFMREYPQLSVRTQWGHPPFGLNPKVANLAHMSRLARYDVVLVSDANVRLQPHALRTLAADLGDDVGMVCNILAGVGARSLGALAECLHLNAFVATSMCGATFFGQRTLVVGKSMLMRRAALERAGGWYGVRDILAEDYVLGQRFRQAGIAVVVSPYVVETVDAQRTLQAFVARHVRWAQMRRHLSPYFWMEMLLNPVPWWLGTALLGMAQDDHHAVAAACFAIFVKGAVDASLHRFLTGERMPFKALLCVVPKDCLVSFVWAVGAFRRTVIWRGNVARIGRGSALTFPEPMPS